MVLEKRLSRGKAPRKLVSRTGCCTLSGRGPASRGRRRFRITQVSSRDNVKVQPSISVEHSRVIRQSDRATWIASSFGGGSNEAFDEHKPIRMQINAIAKHVQRNLLLYAMMLVISVSFTRPSIGIYVHKLKLHKVSAPGIFLLSGLTLNLSEVKSAIKSPLPLILGFLVIKWPFLSSDLVVGMTVFLCVPTALSAGVQIATVNGGNPALALMLTVGSNLLGTLTLPIVICKVLGGNVQVQLDTFMLFKSLVQFILVPLTFGMMMRATIPSLSTIVDKYKSVLAIMTTLLLVMVPLSELSIAVSKKLFMTRGEILQVLGLGLSFPLLFILYNTLVLKLFRGRFAEDVKRTITIVCSLKTLPISVMVLQKIQESMPSLTGIALLPCMIFHILQTLVVSVAASKWKKEKGSNTGT